MTDCSLGSMFPDLPTSIRSLDLTRTWTSSILNVQDVGEISRGLHLPNLEEISLGNSHLCHPDFVYRLLTTTELKITKLLLNAAYAADSFAAALVRWCSEGLLDNLVEFETVRGSQITDEIIETIAPQLPCLEVLNLPQSCVTGVGVKALVNKPGAKIRWLGLKDSPVSSDAIEYARAAGIVVDLRGGPRALVKR